jgi:hypothetical protein
MSVRARTAVIGDINDSNRKAQSHCEVTRCESRSKSPVWLGSCQMMKPA